MREVQVEAIALDRLAALLERDRAERLAEYAARARALLSDRIVWNVNATASGGGVAEMLQALLAYGRGAGVDTRWLVLDGRPDFFRLTKRVHNLLHGAADAGGAVGPGEAEVYQEVLDRNLAALTQRVRPGDVVLLHDPQTAGLIPAVRRLGGRVVWRCHIGKDAPDEHTEAGWAFLRPFLEQAEALIFSRAAFVPAWVDQNRVWIIPPSLDPFTAKNVEIGPHEVGSVLERAGLVGNQGHGPVGFRRRDGSPGVVRPHVGLVEDGLMVPAEARVVLQVSRWDRLKDMAGVLTAFADRLPTLADDVHLVLAGPEVAGVSDDPEAAEVLDDCRARRARLAPAAAARIHLVSLPMDDVDENAYLVNALQRRATVVVQKSLVEGFGLTVTEPMWKARPVVATSVGGIRDQIIDGESGLLLADPTDLDTFGATVAGVLDDVAQADRLGTAAHQRVREHYLGDRHLMQYVDLFEQLYR